MPENVFNILLNLFETTSQLDILYKKAFGDILIDYNYTEMHTIDFIGKTTDPNVTKIAQKLNLTKAAISKIIKKLLNKKAIEIYKNPSNKKEIYYKLTSLGIEVFNKHKNMHDNWCGRDEEFFKQFKKEDLNLTYEILLKYNEALNKRLKNIKEELKNEKNL